MGTWQMNFLGKGKSSGVEMYLIKNLKTQIRSDQNTAQTAEQLSSLKLEKHSWGSVSESLLEHPPNSYAIPFRQFWILEAETASYLQTD